MSMTSDYGVTSYEVYGVRDEFAWGLQSAHYNSAIQCHLVSQQAACTWSNWQNQIIVVEDRTGGAQ